MTGKKKRSRWDDEGDEEESSRSSLSKVGKVKQEKGESGLDGGAVATGASLSLSQPFKWGDKIKVEEAEGVSAKSPSSNGQAGDDYGKEGAEKKQEEKKKANFGLTGALAKDEKTGNLRNGVVMKYSESLDAAVPPHVWRLYVFQGDDIAETLYIHRQPTYLIGKDRRVADIILSHASCSKQHAVIAFRNVEITDKESGSTKRVNKPYLLDLKSTNRTYLNGEEIDDSRYYELREKDCIRFGVGEAEYVILHDQSES